MSKTWFSPSPRSLTSTCPEIPVNRRRHKHTSTSRSAGPRDSGTIAGREGTVMAVNLPPQYHDAEERYKKAKTAAEKLVALREMWVILPKHKASEKVQAALKTKISELTDEIEREKSGPKKAAPGSFRIPRQGAGQVVFLGPPNAGKSF